MPGNTLQVVSFEAVTDALAPLEVTPPQADYGDKSIEQIYGRFNKAVGGIVREDEHFTNTHGNQQGRLYLDHAALGINDYWDNSELGDGQVTASESWRALTISHPQTPEGHDEPSMQRVTFSTHQLRVSSPVTLGISFELEDAAVPISPLFRILGVSIGEQGGTGKVKESIPVGEDSTEHKRAFGVARAILKAIDPAEVQGYRDRGFDERVYFRVKKTHQASL